MTYIKKLVMHGFKSFANRTEIAFDPEMNVVVGPNGSGKSNVSDALCFALGRLSIKSMRAAKAKNLIFMGTKTKKPASEAKVDVVFDNEKGTFPIQKDEVVLTRIVRRSGQSIYKINGETKTRGDVIETLAQAGIDPHGFNLVLQGQIQAIVKMHPEERRKILEEVAGIAIYESRKEKSMKELEKTEARLKEVGAVLRERTGFLRNLEQERSQALKFKDLEKTIERARASIVQKKLSNKEKELASIQKSIGEKTKQKDEMLQKAESVEEGITKIQGEIEKINEHIKRSTGTEQETLRNAVANLRAELEGMRVRRENFSNRKDEIARRIEQMQASIPEHEQEIAELRKESPLVAKKQAELAKKKELLAQLEDERKKVYALKSELKGLKDRLKDKEASVVRVGTESDTLLKQIEEVTQGFIHKDIVACEAALETMRSDATTHKEQIEHHANEVVKTIESISAAQSKIAAAEEIKGNIADIDVCPLCQNTMTEEHFKHVTNDSEKKIKEATEIITQAEQTRAASSKVREDLRTKLAELEVAIARAERERTHHTLVKDKQLLLKERVEQEKVLKEEIIELEKRRDSLEKKTMDTSSLEERYAATLREIEEISSRTEKDLDTTLLYKERELENIRGIVKRSLSDKKEVEEEIAELTTAIDAKKKVLAQKEKEDEEMNARFKKLFEQRDALQKQVQEESYNLSSQQSQWRQIEDQINYLKVGNAKIDAEKEALEMELAECGEFELLPGSIEALQERLSKAKATIQTIGSINMRALEVYDEVKAEYDKVQEKVDTLDKEKLEILKIIDEIDAKKKRTFMKTYRGINELFVRNFSQLSRKGTAALEIENKQDIFSGGVNIAIKMGKGKYFDVTSLSGGEQTLIALSLLFAIQEHKPYHFYFFDEIDAALDKRNSERLSALLKKYKQDGQYLVVTHNDAIILDSNVLYGVTMHEGVSKILSIEVGDAAEKKQVEQPQEASSRAE